MPRKSFATLFVVPLTLWALSVAAADWPCWRGPSRTGVVDELSGYDGKAWPLHESWRENVGEGSTSPIVADGKLFTMGHLNGKETVACLAADTGKQLWSVGYGAPAYGRKANGDQGIYRGTSSTPAFDSETGLLYTLGIDGDLHCWDTARGGAKMWHINLYDEYDPPQRPQVGRSGQRDYGYTTSPLVWGETLIVEVGGKSGNTIGLDKRTGRRRWSSKNTDPAGHTGGLAPITLEGVHCVAVQTHSNLLVMRLDRGREGETVAEFPWVTEFSNSIASPVVEGNCVLVTSGYNHQTICKVECSLEGAKQLWQRDVYSQVCTPIVHRGHIYWAWRDVYCLDWKTGKTVWKGPSGLGDPGSCIVTSDERLIVWSDEGTLLLMETVERSPAKPTVLFRRERMMESDAWPHVVLADGRLYCKDRRGNVSCVVTGDAAKLAMKAGPQDNTVGDQLPYQEKPIDLKSWPGLPGLVLAWNADYSDRRVMGFENGKKRQWDVQLTGDARHDARLGFQLDRGSCRIDGAAETMLKALQASGELTIEIVLVADNTQQNGPARIVSFSSDAYHRNFTLGQEGANFVLRLRTPATGENGQRPEVTLVQVTPRKQQHLVVSYRDGYLATYVDGRLQNESNAVGGDFRNWTPQHFLLGDEHDGGRDWAGSIERLAILNRFVGPQEAARRFELVREK